MTSSTYLGDLERLLLMALVAIGHEAYGVTIRQAIEARTGRLVSPGAIYTALDRLERRGYVTSRLGDPTPQRGGKRKRFYTPSASGVAVLRASHETLSRMARGLRPKLELP